MIQKKRMFPCRHKGVLTARRRRAITTVWSAALGSSDFPWRWVRGGTRTGGHCTPRAATARSSAATAMYRSVRASPAARKPRRWHAQGDGLCQVSEDA
jgi:hypothetical protein